ncbi:zinc-binding dehydrogenase [Pseudomonas sp. NPDC089396]|uniref:zinc-binding dehydrogenase n=1 Tax=Pseudomonas sp. NPDC089396 TaxID=3364461 RepID=UPI003835E6DB
MPVDYAAWCFTPGQGLAGLKLGRKPLGEPGPGEVLVANRAIALNPVDWKMIDWGRPDWGNGQVPGVDAVAEIVACGAGVTLEPGTRVAYHQSLARDGSFAEYALLDSRALLRVPAGLGDRFAAAFPCPGLTAWQALEKVPLEAPRDVLVTGAGGAVGLYLVQLAVARGARVWATASPAHHDALRGLGVVEVFDYHASEWRQTLQRQLGQRRLHAVFDTVSGQHAASLASLLGYNGHLVCIQDRQDQAPLAPFTTAISLHEVALNSIHGHGSDSDWQALRQAGERLLEDLAAGRLQPPQLHAFDFEALPAALGELKRNARSGKWVTQLTR